MSSCSIHVVLLAAGSSTRLGGDIAKPWCDLGGKPVLAHSLQRFADHPRITSGVIVAAEQAIDDAEALALPLGWQVAVGGHERAFSVKAGLEALANDSPDYVLIHDAARPFVVPAVIDTLIATLDEGADAAIPGIPPSDSLKSVHDGMVTGRVDRSGIWRVQTPQAFRYSLIKSCHDADKGGAATDDSSLIEDHGGDVRMIIGDVMMDKITTPDDLARTRLIYAGLSKEGPSSMQDDTRHVAQDEFRHVAQDETRHVTQDEFRHVARDEFRMATGYDVHKFTAAPGPIMLGGVALDHEFGFDAHSDGDVALHALTDAIYGLIADGDIGSHFPPSDDTWKGKDSAFFLTQAHHALKEQNATLSFVDLTIIAELPKIGPHRDAIRTRIAGLLDLPINRVSVKATTSEGLGFTGRREGIAVQAAATARFAMGNEDA